MSDFTRRRAQQLMNGGAPVAAGGPLVDAALPGQVYGVARGADGAVVFQFGDARFALECDDAIRLAMLVLKYAGADVEVTGGEEPAG